MTALAKLKELSTSKSKTNRGFKNRLRTLDRNKKILFSVESTLKQIKNADYVLSNPFGELDQDSLTEGQRETLNMFDLDYILANVSKDEEAIILEQALKRHVGVKIFRYALARYDFDTENKTILLDFIEDCIHRIHFMRSSQGIIEQGYQIEYDFLMKHKEIMLDLLIKAAENRFPESWGKDVLPYNSDCRDDKDKSRPENVKYFCYFVCSYGKDLFKDCSNEILNRLLKLAREEKKYFKCGFASFLAQFIGIDERIENFISDQISLGHRPTITANAEFFNSNKKSELLGPFVTRLRDILSCTPVNNQKMKSEKSANIFEFFFRSNKKCFFPEERILSEENVRNRFLELLMISSDSERYSCWLSSFEYLITFLSSYENLLSFLRLEDPKVSKILFNLSVNEPESFIIFLDAHSKQVVELIKTLISRELETLPAALRKTWNNELKPASW